MSLFMQVPNGWAEEHPDPGYENLVLEVGERASSYLGYDLHLIEWYLT